MVTVCAVLPRPGSELDSALERQRRPPDEIVRSEPGRDALAVGLAGEATWLWILDGTAVPTPEALDALSRSTDLGSPLPPPVLLASKVIEPDGALAERRAPWYRRRATDVAMLAVTRHLLPVRAAQTGSVLVRRSAVAAQGARPALHQAAGLAWTASVLRDGAGYMVPASVVISRGGGPAGDDLRAALQLLRGDALTGRERLQFVAENVAGVLTPRS